MAESTEDTKDVPLWEVEDITEITHLSVIQSLVTKHRGGKDSLEHELAELKVNLKGEEKEITKQRKLRNNLNDEVVKLKERREKLHKEVRALRSEFFSLIEEASKLQDSVQELNKYRKVVAQAEWRIQTEAVTLDQEKEELTSIRNAMEKLDTASSAFQKKLGIETKVSELKKKIGDGTEEAQSSHEKLVEQAAQSDVHHRKVVELDSEVYRKKGQMRLIEHRLSRHSECLKHWDKEFEKAWKWKSRGGAPPKPQDVREAETKKRREGRKKVKGAKPPEGGESK